MKVYEKVREYIVANGYKQVAIAKKAGIPNATFNAIMNGKRTLYADDLSSICIALKVMNLIESLSDKEITEDMTDELNLMVLVKKYVGLAECPDFGTPKVVSYDYLMNFEVIII